MIELLLCHGCDLARRRVHDLLVAQGELVVVGEAATSGAALDAVRVLRPDIALIDVHLPPKGGTAVAETIRSTASGVKVVAWVEREAAAEAMWMIDVGATGAYVDDDPLWQLEQALVGASGPLARLGFRLHGARHRNAIVTAAADELASITGAWLAAAYVCDRHGEPKLLTVSGAGDGLTLEKPAPVLEAVREGHVVGKHGVAAAAAVGARLCTQVVAAPVFGADGPEAVVLLAMDERSGLRIDRDLVEAVVTLASAAAHRLHVSASEPR